VVGGTKLNKKKWFS